ncbi:MAG: ATP-binding protein [Treponemataceae bacterium]|nr:ATP-binding protein [Treponemataceae bacterium]
MKHKSLTFSIFLSTFFAGVLVYFICACLFISNMYGYFEKQLFEELKTESVLLEVYDVSEGSSDLQRLTHLKTKNRITLIHPDGTVFYDNTVNAATLENHALRSEFLKAKEQGVSTSSRYSSTMLEKTLYFAKELDTGDILRISCNQHTVGVLVLGMSQILLIMLVIAMAFSGIAASLLSKRITEPLNRIDLENPEATEVYDELKPFTRRIAEENFEKSQREELRQQFTANVSHELKTPLTSISGFAEILGQGGTDAQTTKDFALTIYEESQRMITLVNDIIKLSKLDEKSISLEKEALSLKEIAEEAIETLTPVAAKKQIELTLSGDTGLINGVRPVIYEMIYNLIDNAIKYNRDNGLVAVKIENMMASHTVVLTVQDTGIGIPEREKERIFERFYRIDKSRSRQLGGTGLGLSIVKHAAKYHNAQILLTSKEGEGSTFTVVFSL